MDGPAARERLVAEADRLLRTYRTRASECYGRLVENKVFILILGNRLEAARDAIRAYFGASDFEDARETHVRLRTQRGYVLSELGETVEGARSYYEAAAYARDVAADVGSRALAEAASTARLLGDHIASAHYIEATLDLVRDSLSTNDGLRESYGLVLTSKALLTKESFESQPGDSLSYAEGTLLLEDAAAALDALPSQGQSVGFRGVAMSLQALAHQMRGEPELSDRSLRLAHELAREVGPLLPNARTTVSMLESEVCVWRGDYECAQIAASRAAADALERSDLEAEAAATEQLGIIAERKQDWDQARDHFQRAIDYREALRVRLGLQDWNAATFANAQRPYQGLIRTLLATDQTREAFHVLDATHARYLRDLVQHHAIRRDMDAERRAHVDSLSSELIDVRARLARQIPPTLRVDLTSKASLLLTEIEKATRVEMSADSGLDLEAYQRHLRDQDQTLVSYSITPGGSVAFVVSADSVVAVRIDLSPRTTQRLLRRVGTPWSTEVDVDPVLSLDALHILYRRLWMPLRGFVQTESVVIIPDDVTATVPFAALTSEPSGSYKSAPYLLRKHAISYDVSAALSMNASSPTDRLRDALLMGKSTFEGSMWNTPLPPLPYVEEEIDGVHAILGGVALENDSATEDAFYQLAQNAGVIHLASHAEADPIFPLYSRIELEAGGGQDGTLHLYEILETTLDSDMVILSGCSTGGGSVMAGEGIVGLQYGMRAAGSRSTVTTLWTVADDASSELMTSFYRNLASGDSKDEAMRTAQLEYLGTHQGIRASPFFWAAPIVSGDVSPLTLQNRRMKWTVWLAVTTILLGIAWATLRRQTHGRTERPF